MGRTRQAEAAISNLKEKEAIPKIIKNKVQLFFFSVIVFLILIVLIFAIISPTNFTGLFTGNSKENIQTFSQEINFTSNYSSTYEWKLENSRKLNSLKLSGLVELNNNSEVKIYLEELLIFDSSKIKKKSNSVSKITGKAIEETEQFNESYSEQETPLQEESSPSQEESLTENQTAEKEIFSVSNESYSEQETPLQEESSPSQEESLTENQTIETNQETNKTEIKEISNQNQSNESYSEQETPLQEESSPSQEESLTENLEILEFSDICEETCDLEKLNLTNSSYKIRIEISGNATLILESINYSIIEELQEIPEIQLNLTNETINTTQYPAILGQPVKWKKSISNPENVTIKVELPKEAENISVDKVTYKKAQFNKSYSEKKTPLQEESSPSQEESLTENLTENIGKEKINPKIEKISKKEKGNTKEYIEVLIEGNSPFYEIEYETPAPQAIEERLSNGKKVKVTSPDEIHYEKILAYTELEENLSITDVSQIQIFWVEQNTSIPFEKIEDKNLNGVYDYIEWIIPHLSNQTFLITIQPGSEGKDTYIDEASVNRNYGASTRLIVNALDRRRALIEFDLSEITSTANIINANLTLYLASKGTGANIPINIYRINHSWIEGTGNDQITADGTTWNNRSGNESWNSAGGDFNPTLIATKNVSSEDTFYTWDLTELVESWINGTYTNYGIIIRAGSGDGIWQFASSEDSNATRRPKLNVTYNESTIPVINSVNMPSTIREGENISLTANITDNLEVANVSIEIDNENYSLGQNPQTVSSNMIIRPISKGAIETNQVINYPNVYDNNNETYAGINDINHMLTVKTPGVSATGKINSVKIKVIHSRAAYNTIGYVHWAISTENQGLTHEFNSTSESLETVEFDVTSERNWTFEDFNLLTEIHINNSDNILRVYETWFEINYTTPASNDLWNATINTSLFSPGNYTYSLFANDSSQNIGVYNGNFTILPSLVLMNVSMNDAQGNFQESEVIIYGENNEIEMNSTMTESQLISIEEGEKDILIIPADTTITQIEYKNTTIEEHVDAIIDIDHPEEKGNFTTIYALNPHLGTNATVRVVATGNELYKCKDWNFSEQYCFGEWIKVMDLVPGEEYNFTLNPEDPGFGEIILITKAEHLSSNRTYISDIYNEIKGLDNIWSETISENEYIRITFEIPLDNTKDITLYPRIVSGDPRIEVYEFNESNLIAEFDSIADNTYNTVYLTNLIGEQSKFDLKVVDGSLEFDHILDPSVWVKDLAINASLPDAGSNSTPSVFYKDSSWYILNGNLAGTFNGYVWNGTNWLVNTTINRTMVDIGANTHPSVFYISPDWYAISGMTTGRLYTYKWNGTDFETNKTMNISLPDLGSNTAPTVFYKDSSWYLISGELGGRFFGYVWNGSSFVKNLTINNSLPDIGALSKPNVFQKDGVYYMLAGESSGTFKGFAWDGTQWLPNSTINASLPDIGTFSTPSVFYKDSAWYMISGENLGRFFGYNYSSDETPPFYSSVSSNNTMLDSITLFSVNVNDNYILNPNGGYIFSTNNTGSWVNDSFVSFSSTPSWANVSKILNSTLGTVIGYMWYFNDSAGNTNSTLIYTLTTTEYELQCGILNSADTIYTLTQNLSSTGDCFNIAAVNITLDCDGYSIIGNNNQGAKAINVGTPNATIKNCILKNWSTDLYVENTENTTIKNITGGSEYGLIVNGTSNSNFTDLSFNNISITGILITNNSHNNTFTNIRINSSAHGIYLESGQNNTFDCANGLINYSRNGSNYFYGIYTNQFNTTIKNCNVLDGNLGSSGTERHGVYLYTSTYSTLSNCFILGNNSPTISLNEAHFSSIINNTGISGNRAIHLLDTNNTLIKNNTGNSTLNNPGIHVYGTCSNNTFINNTVLSREYSLFLESNYPTKGTSNNLLINNTLTSTQSTALMFSGSNNNTIINQIAESKAAYAIDLASSANNTFRDCINLTGASQEISLGWDSGSFNNTLINCSYGQEYIPVIENWMLIKWYYQAYVNYTNGTPASNINITAYNSFGNIEFTALTNSSGWISRQEVTDYNATNTGRVFYSNYTLFANKSGTGNDTNILNITFNQNKLNDWFTIEGASLQCGTLDTANAVYTLTSNVSSTGTCFDITQSNVTLDCNGYWINYSLGGEANTYGVYSYNTNNLTIKNCNIVDGNWTSSNEYSRGGIAINTVTNSTIINNTVKVNNSYGIYLDSTSNYNNITSNNVSSNTSIGIILDDNSMYNILINNTATSNGDVALFIYQSSDYNTLIENNATSRFAGCFIYFAGNNNLSNNTFTNKIGTDYGLYLYDAYNNLFINNTAVSEVGTATHLGISVNNTFIQHTSRVIGEGYQGISLDSSTNNTMIRDCVDISGFEGDVSSNDNSINNTFINCSYNDESIDGADVQLIRKWYYQAYANYSNGTAVDGANISAYNTTGQLQFTELTNSTGYIPRQEVTEYVNTGGTRSYYNNYTIFANKSTALSNASNVINITATLNKLNDVFTLEGTVGDNTPPIITLHFPTGSIADVTPLINVSSNEMGTIWYNINNGTNITLCTYCNNSQNNYLYLEEGTYFLYLFANDSSGNLNSSIPSSLTINMNSNYYDNFNDNSSIRSSNNINWISSNISFAGGYNYLNDPNLVSLYLFENSGNLGLDTQGNNNMANVGDPAQNSTIPNGFTGYSIQLDGNDQVCNYSGFTFNASENHTMCFWVMKTGFTDDGNVFAQHCTYDTWDQGYNYTFTANNCYNPESISIPSVFSQSQWVHICQSYDSIIDNMTFYIDGQENSSHVFTNPLEYHSENAWCIGGCDGACWVEGNVFQPMWFDRILNPDEILSIYSNEIGDASGNFTSYAINTTQNITEITNITWTELNTDTNNNITVQISADGGTTWYTATSGNELGQTFTGENNSLVYRVLFITNSSTTIAISDINISWSSETKVPGENACGTLSTIGKTYTLVSNVSSQGTCFLIDRPNITLDCNGYWINYSINGTDYGRGIYTNQFNTTIRNCNIVDGNITNTNTNRQGIYFYQSTNGTIYNNSVISNNSQAIHLRLNSNFNNVTNNFIQGFSDIGLDMHTSNNNNITNNLIITNSSVDSALVVYQSSDNILVNNTAIGGAYGIYIVGTASTSSNNNLLINNTAISNIGSAIRLVLGNNNQFVNQIAISYSSGDYALSVDDANNTRFVDCINLSSSPNQIYIHTGDSLNNSFINCSYTSEWVREGNTELIRKWYYQAYANNTGGSPVEGANISAYNTTGQLQFTLLTNSSGLIDRQEVIEYINTGGTKSYYNNYTIFANKSTASSNDSNVINISVTLNKLDDVFTLEEVSTADCTTIGNSGTLDSAGTVYTLTSNVSSTGTCFTISASNITLDCNGYWINYSTNGGSNEQGIFLNEISGFTLKNCNIVDGNFGDINEDRYGLFAILGYNHTIFNTKIITNHSSSIAVDGLVMLNLSNNILFSNDSSTPGAVLGLTNLSYANIINNNLTNNIGFGVDGYFYNSNFSNNNLYTNSTAFYNLASENSTLLNNIITSVNGYGMSLNGYKNNIISNNKITAGYFGIWVAASSVQNSFINNSIISNESGLTLYESGNNTFINNTFESFASDRGVWFYYSDNINIANSDFLCLTTGCTAVHIQDSENILFRDCRNITGNVYDIENSNYGAGGITNVTLVNCSYNAFKEYVDEGNQLIRKWYYQAYANYTNGTAIIGANVTAYNSSGDLQFTKLTNSSGYIGKQEVVEYANTGGTRSYYSNYTIFVNKSTASSNDSNVINISVTLNKLDDVFTLEEALDIITPNITFEEPPTPSNDSIVNSSTQTIVANISDDSTGNTSSWIDVDRSLAGYWSMDYYNATGIYDNSTYNNFGTFNGGLNYSNLTDGIRGQGIIFDGVNNYINVTNNENLQITGNITISSWVKFSETQNNVPMIAKWAGEDKGYLLMIDYHSDNRLAFAISVSDVNREAISSNTYGDGVWHHVVGIFNGSNVLLYIDNGAEKIVGDSTTGPIDNPNLDLVLGDYSTPGMHFNGSLDEVMIFNRSLSENEISALYNSQSNLFNVTLTNLSEGQHNYTVYAIDEAGNYNTSGERNFVVDTEVVGENACGTLDSANTVYTLTQNVSSDGTCFTIAAANITLDCNGYWINYTGLGAENASGVETTQFNTTVKNCNIYNYTIGIFFNGADNGTIENNNITLYNNKTLSILDYSLATKSSGIIIYNSADYNNIVNNKVYSHYGTGIYINEAQNNTIINCNSTSHFYPGIKFYSDVYGENKGVNNSIINSYALSDEESGIYMGWYGGNHSVINSTGISNGDSSYVYGIHSAYAAGNRILNSLGKSNHGDGINFIATEYSYIINSTGISENDGNGITITYVSQYNLIENSTGISNTWGGYGIAISSGSGVLSNNNILENSIAISKGYGGIFLGGNNNTIRRNNITGYMGYFISNLSNSVISDCIYTLGETNDVELGGYGENSSNVTFINCSYDTEYLTAGDELIRKWYYQTYTNYTNGTAVEGANISAYNTTGQLQFTELTNSTGYIPRQEVIEYINAGGTRSYYNNYTINATLSGYGTDSNIFNFTTTQNKIDDWFTLSENLIPGENSCGTLDEAGQTYTLTQNVSSDGTCFTIAAANITLDCNEYWINYSIGGEANTYGVYSDQFNTTVRNCNIVDGNWSSEAGTSRYGIFYQNSDNGKIFNNSINTSNSNVIDIREGSQLNNLSSNEIYSISGIGINLYDTSSNILEKNNITSISNIGLELTTYSIENNITNNNISSNSGEGIAIETSSNNNILINNTATSAASSNPTIVLAGVYNNTLINNIFISTDYISLLINSGSGGNIFIQNSFIGDNVGIFFEESSNNLFKDCNISGGTDVYNDYGVSSNITFLNCSYNFENIQYASTNIIRKWYFDANVSYSNNTAIEDANLSLYDSSSELISSQLTDSNGDISRQEVTEYVNTGGTRVYQTPNTVNITKDGYLTNSTVYNLTKLQNVFANIILEENSLPQIYSVTPVSPVTLTEGPAPTFLIINFSVYDANGVSNLNSSTATINFTKSGEELRYNNSCIQYQSSGNYANYTCNVTMWWFDASGNDWRVYVNISDMDGNLVVNDSRVFTVNTLTGFVTDYSNLNFAALVAGSHNQTPVNHFTLNNTGNVDITVGNIEINATDLVGETTHDRFLFAGNFSASPYTGNKIECSLNSSSTQLSNYTFTKVANTVLPSGNYTLNDGTAQEEVYLCLREVGVELSQQQYSTDSFGSWTIRIVLVALSIRTRKKKKNSNAAELTIPATIFTKKLGALESTVKYMKENLGLTYHTIAEMLNRNERTIWTAYNKSIEKYKETIEVKETEIFIPLSILNNRKLTILESVIVYLRNKDMTYSEISKLIERDQRNVRSIYIGLEQRLKEKQTIISQLTIPATIFTKKLGALESTVKYMKENLGLTYHTIAEMLNRNERTIWTAYNKSIEKYKETIEVKETEIFIPLSILNNRKLTILESVIVYLRNKDMTYSEISKLIERDQRNVRSIYFKENNNI